MLPAGESDKIIILDDDAPPFVKFTTLTSGNDTNEETIATSDYIYYWSF